MDFQDQFKKPQNDLWQTAPSAPARSLGPPPVRSAMPPMTDGHGGPVTSPEDLAKLADRAAAKEELKNLFQIVDPESDAERLPNHVTPEQYEQLCNQYSDIRTGNSQIKIDTGDRKGEEADEFKKFLMGDIESLLQTESGRALIGQLSTMTDAGNQPLTTTIMGAASPNQAKAHTTQRTEAANTWSENGVGTDMTVEYAPGEDVSKPGSTSPWFPMRSDVVLFHEMTHALHGARGEFQKGKISQDEMGPDDLPGVPLEEYATVGLGRFANNDITENSYRAERRALADQPGMRRGDDDWAMERRTSYLTSNPLEEAREAERRRKMGQSG